MSEQWQVNDQTASGVMNNSVYICNEAGLNIARVFNDYGNQIANARSIVACVNACAGVPTEELETGEVHVVIHRKLDPVDLPAAFPFEITREMEVDKLVLVSQRLQQQRDHLLVALNGMLNVGDSVTFQQRARENARAAIAEIEANQGAKP